MTLDLAALQKIFGTLFPQDQSLSLVPKSLALQPNSSCSLRSLRPISSVAPADHPPPHNLPSPSPCCIPASKSRRHILLNHRPHLPENQMDCAQNFSCLPSVSQIQSHSHIMSAVTENHPSLSLPTSPAVPQTIPS